MTQPADDPILYLSGSDVRRMVAEIDPVAVVREVFRLHGEGGTILPDEAYLGWENERGERLRSLNMPGYVGGAIRTPGTKIINANPANPGRGLPRASGVTMVFDADTGRIACIMEGATISSLRTASVSALAVDLLRGGPIEHLAVIGAGVLARAHLELFAQRLPELRRVMLFDLEPGRTEALRRETAAALEGRGIAVDVMPSAEAAVRPAQLIVPCTTTTTGYIGFDWLSPGAILVNVSLDDAKADVVLRADLVVVDDWGLVKADPRRLLGRMVREGLVTGPDDPPAADGRARRIDAQIGDLVVGRKPGRRSPKDIVLVNPFGLAIEDVAIAAGVYRAAKARNLGIELPR
jgi:N-[(2S)-2-amino-2-carboxyethyl]-L-glutamate dehydrogenase